MTGFEVTARCAEQNGSDVVVYVGRRIESDSVITLHKQTAAQQQLGKRSVAVVVQVLQLHTYLPTKLVSEPTFDLHIMIEVSSAYTHISPPTYPPPFPPRRNNRRPILSPSTTLLLASPHWCHSTQSTQQLPCCRRHIPRTLPTPFHLHNLLLLCAFLLCILLDELMV